MPSGLQNNDPESNSFMDKLLREQRAAAARATQAAKATQTTTNKPMTWLQKLQQPAYKTNQEIAQAVGQAARQTQAQQATAMPYGSAYAGYKQATVYPQQNMGLYKIPMPSQNVNSMYNNWQAPGFLPTAQPGGMNVGPGYIDPSKTYLQNMTAYQDYLKGKIDPQKPWGSSDATRNYVYGDNKSGRQPINNDYYPGQMNTETTRDLLPDNWQGWRPPSTLPLPGGGSGGGGGGGGGGGSNQSYDYPIYGGYGGGGSSSSINQWYANMVQWNINRPKGG